MGTIVLAWLSNAQRKLVLHLSSELVISYFARFVLQMYVFRTVRTDHFGGFYCRCYTFRCDLLDH